MSTVLDLGLGVAVLIVTGLSLLARSRLVMSMSFLVLGVLVAIVWLRLSSLDVALAEAAIGTGLLSALLVWLAVRSPLPPGAGRMETSHRLRWLRPAVGLVAGTVLTVVTAAVWVRADHRLPAWGEPAQAQLPDTGVEHPITGVLLAFRAYDTLLESGILMLTAAAVLALSRRGGLSAGSTHQLSIHQASAALPPVPATLSWAARMLTPALVLLGLWLLFAGSTDSGGAFQSGAVLAAALILLHCAQVDLRVFQARWLRPLLVGGVVVFVLAGLVGPLLGLPWLSWEPEWAFAAVLVVEVLLTAGITAGLYALFLALENPEGVR
ncbi:MnhB domain-containing protein [Nesterenkonia sphaerica]|uniref:DUF4040 domain-containing protein n=1 Tax=Nesterenkonia sphaerica TaxID=1804988 RepID=A0A5R9APN6_9MICC|nr:MnhB domain-containing protein [Nesterenkonia sphaerica]TLP79845.1 DUF4040 domain-containing protein [Nesterenkonia sphaerica]